MINSHKQIFCCNNFRRLIYLNINIALLGKEYQKPNKYLMLMQNFRKQYYLMILYNYWIDLRNNFSSCYEFLWDHFLSIKKRNNSRCHRCWRWDFCYRGSFFVNIKKTFAHKNMNAFKVIFFLQILEHFII